MNRGFTLVHTLFSLNLNRLIKTGLFSLAFLLAANLYAAKPQVIYDQDLKYSVRTLKVQKGDGLASILRRNGVSSELANRALSTSKLKDDFRFIKKQRYLIFTSRSNKDKKFRFYCPYSPYVYTLGVSGKKVVWEVSEANLDIEVTFASGKVRGSLFQSITKKIPDDLIAYRFMDAYQLDYKIQKKIQRDAKFSLHVEKQFDEGQFIRFGEVLNTTLEINGKIDERSYIRYPGGGAFVANQDSHGDRPFYSPVNYIKVSSAFKPRRFHPIKRRRVAHLGIDFALPKGEPIFAPASGRVTKKGRTRAAGRYVVITHKNGLTSYYNHMNEIDKSIYKGKNIKAGEPLGTIGCTGYCTLPHLHFAIKKKGRFVDPAKYTRSYPFHQKHLFENRKIH